MKIQYQSQKLAYGYFVTMFILFILQISFGLVLSAIQMDPYFMQGALNFNVARAFHLNLGIVWIVTGFAGTLFFIGPVLGGRETSPTFLVKFLLFAIWVVVAWSIFTLPKAMWGDAGWIEGSAWIGPIYQQGLEYLEGGRVTGVLLLVGFSILAYLVVRMFPPRKEWNEVHWGLAIGLSGLTFMWLFAFIPTRQIDVQEYFRWYIVHYWVEGVWEIIHISLVGILLQKFFDVDPKEVGFAVFWGVVLVALTGLIGNAHHYFWIGTPSFWQFWGSLFSALEPLPLIFCIWHVFIDAKSGAKPLRNKVGFYFIAGSAIFEHVGAGILGFTQTFALTNLWEHGTWVTASHGHLALFGTFGMLVIGGAYTAVPAIKGVRRWDDRLSRFAFWTMFSGMLGIMLAFAAGGTIQIYVYRVLGLDWFGEYLRPAMAVPRALLGLFGVIFTVGAIVGGYDLATIKSRALGDDETVVQHHAITTGLWRSALTRFEMGMWIAGMWLFGGIITLNLLSFNMSAVRAGDPTIPYTLGSIGYPGLLGVTLLFGIRLLRSFEGRQAALSAVTSITDADKLGMVDLREQPKGRRERYVAEQYTSLGLGKAFVLVSDSDPKELLAHLEHHEASLSLSYLEKGPSLWRVQVGRVG